MDKAQFSRLCQRGVCSWERVIFLVGTGAVIGIILLLALFLTSKHYETGALGFQAHTKINSSFLNTSLFRCCLLFQQHQRPVA